MFRFIILGSSLLSLFLLGFVSSEQTVLNVIPAHHGFKTSTDLHGYYTQQDSEFGGFHKAKIYFKTKVPSINLDRAGVSNIYCDDGKITLQLMNRKAIKQISNWPENVLLLISHKWLCFNQTTTQFFMVKDRTLDESNQEATLTVDYINVNEWVEKFSVDVSWDANKKNRKRKRNNRSRLNKRVDFPKINLDKKISLNSLFNDKTGRTSTPNTPLIDGSLYCANCFASGEATIGMRLAANLSSPLNPSLTEASITLKGDIRLNLDLSLKPSSGSDILSVNRKLLNFPVAPNGFGIPNIFSVGPSVDLLASANITAGAESTFNFGGEIGLSNFSVKASFADEPTFEQTGFKPHAKTHGLEVNLGNSININSSITPRLSFRIDILDGLFSRQAGFLLNAAFDAGVTVGDQANCRSSQSRIKNDLNGDICFFLNDNEFPIMALPSVTLLNQCEEDDIRIG